MTSSAAEATRRSISAGFVREVMWRLWTNRKGKQRNQRWGCTLGSRRNRVDVGHFVEDRCGNRRDPTRLLWTLGRPQLKVSPGESGEGKNGVAYAG